MDKKRIVPISTPYLTLGQLLKLVNIIGNGGEAKSYLATHEVKVNGEPDNRRGRKLYPGDEILVAGQAFAIGR
ncbi:MAG: S4 domain-containing protein YaaA [Bacilli bacterium]|nr:S4 domain-containing protein YaaA [Bacilli bacterium]